MTELEMLRALLAQDRLKLGIHIRKMNSPGSPVYRATENVLAPALVVAASLLATKFLHFYVGAAVLALGCWWWLYRLMPKIKDGVFERTSNLVLSDERQFDAYWRADVLSLFAELPDGTRRAAARRDDWRAFVRDLYENKA